MTGPFGVHEAMPVRGIVRVRLWTPRRNWWSLGGRRSWLAADAVGENIITQVGRQYYAERAAGIASPPGQVTGMRLGTGTTAAATSGAGAAIVSYIAGSHAAIAGGFPTSSNPSGATRRIAWRSTWAAGVATNAAIAEAVITNESPLTDVAGTAANTIARITSADWSPTGAINKGASDTLQIDWLHDIG